MEPVTLIDRGIYMLNGWRYVAVQISGADLDQRLYTEARWIDRVRSNRDSAPAATFEADGTFTVNGQRHHASELRYAGGRSVDPAPDAVRRVLPDRERTFVPGLRQSLQTVARADATVRADDPAAYWRPIG